MIVFTFSGFILLHSFLNNLIKGTFYIMGLVGSNPSPKIKTDLQKRVDYYRAVRTSGSYHKFDRFSGGSIRGVTNVVRFREYLYLHPFNTVNDNFISVERIMDSFFKGRTDDCVSPFRYRIPTALGIKCPPADRDVVISEVVTEILSKNAFYNSSPQLKQFEENQLKRYSTTSVQTPFMAKDGLLDSLTPYFDSNASSKKTFDKSILDESFELLRNLIPLGSLEPDDVTSVAHNSDKSSAYGAPYYKRGNQVDTETGYTIWELHLGLAISMIDSGFITNFVAVMYCRITPNGTDQPNQRTVWGISHAVVLVELTFLHPLLRQLSLLDPFSEIRGSENTDLVVDKAMKSKRAYKYLGVDFSGYDKSIIKDLIDRLYKVIASWFTPGSSNLIIQLGVYMRSSDIISPIGVHTCREKSIASGMGMTNLADSLLQWVLFTYSRLLLKAKELECFITTNGDDGIWGIPGLTPELFCEIISCFGMKSNPSKCSYDEESVSFCQRLYIKGYIVDGSHRGIRSAHRVVASIIRYERKRDYRVWQRVHDSIRCVMQLENLKYSPVFESVVDLLIEADGDYNLGLNLTGGVQELFSIGGGVEGVPELLGTSS
jgi:hypothetical protein